MHRKGCASLFHAHAVGCPAFVELSLGVSVLWPNSTVAAVVPFHASQDVTSRARIRDWPRFAFMLPAGTPATVAVR
eukprot:8487150-Lingulodinium_polyedra.AAC.1